MAKRPAMQFYPGDWRANANLRRCPFAERGIWLEVMCLMHDNDEYGVLRWPLKDIAQAIGCNVKDLRGLSAKEVLKGADDGEQCAGFIYRPRHAGQEGEPVELIPEQVGPIWYSSRMVKDEYVRSKRGEGTRFGQEPIRRDGDSLKVTPIRREGDGPSTSSSSSASSVQGDAYASLVNAAGVPPCPHREVIALYSKHLPMGVQVKPDLWNGSRAKHLQARWRESPERQNLDWWDKFFEHCARSRFLTGQAASHGREPFVVRLDWLLKPENFAKVYEGVYHRQEAA